MPEAEQPPPTGEDIEWPGTGENPEDLIHGEGREALRTRDAASLGQYLREAKVPDPEIIRRLADLLDPRDGAAHDLTFRRRSRGRPVDENKTFEKGGIYMMLWSAHRSLGKLEAAVNYVAERTGRSRSSLMATWGGGRRRKAEMSTKTDKQG
jgi:hypothetical protein